MLYILIWVCDCEENNLEFKHRPVLLEEAVNGLNIQKNNIYVDGTIRRSRSQHRNCKSTR